MTRNIQMYFVYVKLWNVVFIQRRKKTKMIQNGRKEPESGEKGRNRVNRPTGTNRGQKGQTGVTGCQGPTGGWEQQGSLEATRGNDSQRNNWD